MSSHVIEDHKVRWIFGWNQDYRSFFLTKHDKTLSDDENPIFRVGVHPYEIPTADDLFALAAMVRLNLPQTVRLELYREKEYDRSTHYVLHYDEEFVTGIKVDSLTHAELLKDALAPARPDQELQIRRVMLYTRDMVERDAE